MTPSCFAVLTGQVPAAAEGHGAFHGVAQAIAGLADSGDLLTRCFLTWLGCPW